MNSWDGRLGVRRFAVLAAIVLAACASKPAPEVKIDPALATLVPADTVLLAGVRVEALTKTPVYQKYFAGARFEAVEDFAKKTGIDPRKDLWELLYVSNGKQGVLLGRGKFATEEEPRLAHEGARRFGYKGITLIGNDAEAVALINPSTAAAGETAALRSLIDQRANSQGPPAALARLMREIPPEAQLWAAYVGGTIDLPFGDNVTKLLGSLEGGSVYFDLRSGLKGVASGVGRTESAAQDVAGALKVLIALGGLDQSIRVAGESRRVKVSVDAPPELVEKFLGPWTKR